MNYLIYMSETRACYINQLCYNCIKLVECRNSGFRPHIQVHQEVHSHGICSLEPKCALESPHAANRDIWHIMSVPWAMEMNGISREGPERLVRTLTGAILGCGGWVIRRTANDTGRVNLLFEFERQACVDIYSLLIAAGVELGESEHLRFTELCQCTHNRPPNCRTEIASINLEVQTLSN